MTNERTRTWLDAIRLVPLLVGVAIGLLLDAGLLQPEDVHVLEPLLRERCGSRSSPSLPVPSPGLT